MQVSFNTHSGIFTSLIAVFAIGCCYPLKSIAQTRVAINKINQDCYCNNLRPSKSDEILTLLNQNMIDAEVFSYEKGIVRSLWLKAENQAATGDYNKSNKTLNELLDHIIYLEKNPVYLFNIEIQRSINFANLHLPLISQLHFNRASQYFERIQNKAALDESYLKYHLTAVMYDLKKESPLKTYNELLALNEKIIPEASGINSCFREKYYKANTYAVLGMIQLGLNNTDSAHYFLSVAKNIMEGEENNSLLSYIYYGLAKLYGNKADYSKANNFIELANSSSKAFSQSTLLLNIYQYQYELATTTKMPLQQRKSMLSYQYLKDSLLQLQQSSEAQLLDMFKLQERVYNIKKNQRILDGYIVLVLPLIFCTLVIVHFLQAYQKEPAGSSIYPYEQTPY